MGFLVRLIVMSERRPDRIAVFPGDHSGPEVIGAAKRVMEAIGGVETTDYLIGGASIEKYGVPLTDETLAASLDHDAILLGAVGGPEWDDLPPEVRPERGLLRLRQEGEFGTNLRPAKVYPQLLDSSPYRSERIEGMDLLVVREAVGGIYFGESGRDERGAYYDTCEYSSLEISDVVYDAFQLAQQRAWEHDRPAKVTVVTDDPKMATAQLWEQVAGKIASHYPGVEYECLDRKTAIRRLTEDPRQFDVLVTENMLGDIISDATAGQTGTLGLAASTSLNKRSQSLSEPVHGSAPDIAGRQEANPIATILSVAMMYRHGLNRPEDATLIEHAVEQVLEIGYRTPDLMPVDPADREYWHLECSTTEMTGMVVTLIKRIKEDRAVSPWPK